MPLDDAGLWASIDRELAAGRKIEAIKSRPGILVLMALAAWGWI